MPAPPVNSAVASTAMEKERCASLMGISLG
jgi:hypothetical protein